MQEVCTIPSVLGEEGDDSAVVGTLAVDVDRDASPVLAGPEGFGEQWILDHLEVARELGKPTILEEYGMKVTRSWGNLGAISQGPSATAARSQHECASSGDSGKTHGLGTALH